LHELLLEVLDVIKAIYATNHHVPALLLLTSFLVWTLY